MTSLRVTVAVAAVAVILGITGEAAAQMLTAPAQSAPPCMANFVPLRQEAEKRAVLIKNGAQKKQGPQEMCGLFKSYFEAESRVLKFLEDNQASCGIPPQAVADVKGTHAKTAQIKQRVCAAASGEGPDGKPKGPGLGDALGVRAVPTPETTKTGRSIFDTLSGTTEPAQ